jgi:hypothetical protein
MQAVIAKANTTFMITQSFAAVCIVLVIDVITFVKEALA